MIELLLSGKENFVMLRKILEEDEQDIQDHYYRNLEVIRGHQQIIKNTLLQAGKKLTRRSPRSLFPFLRIARQSALRAITMTVSRELDRFL